jgi:2-iminobutanoate/2-iminopropanoate deaminase
VTKAKVHSDKAPAAIGLYSQAMAADGLVFVSGQLPIDPETGRIPDDSIAHRTHLCLRNMRSIAEAAGGSLADVVKTTIFLKDMNDFKDVNAVYAEYFGEPFPARSTVQVAALPLGSDIEIEAVLQL